MALRDILKRMRPGRPRLEPARDTVPFTALSQLGQTNRFRQLAAKPTPRNLRAFSRTVYARRAINAIKNPIAMLEWEIVPIAGVTMNRELERQIAVATTCLATPNNDDSFRTLIEAVVEDMMLGAGAIELATGGDPVRPLWLYPVDGLSVQIVPLWNGQADQARYAQVAGSGTEPVWLRNDELMYLRPNPNTSSPFGLGPLEVAFNSIARIIGVGDFAGNVASNARPSIGLDLGEGIDPERAGAFRSYWRNEVEGQGIMPIFALGGGGSEKSRGPSVMRFFPEGDDGLYLKWQEFLKAEIATAFDLSPMNLGVERDINRNTAEVGQDRDRDNAIKPHARLVSAHLTREAIQATLGFSQLQHRFKGLDPEDEEMHATVYEREYLNNAVTPNEYRERRGMPPSTSRWADMVAADVEIALAAARPAPTAGPGDKPGTARKPTGKPGGDKKPEPGVKPKDGDTSNPKDKAR